MDPRMCEIHANSEEFDKIGAEDRCRWPSLNTGVIATPQHLKVLKKAVGENFSGENMEKRLIPDKRFISRESQLLITFTFII